MKKYEVTGMSCAACSARVEKAVGELAGIKSCSVSLLTNTMSVEGEVSNEEIMEAVVKAGYGIQPQEGKDKAKENKGSMEEALKDKETPLLKKRLWCSLFFMIILMYFSMGVVMWNWPAPDIFTKNPAAMGLVQLILTTIILIINQKFFINGTKGLFHGSPNMDTLVALGSAASMSYSIYALFAMTGQMAQGNMTQAHHYLHEFYFESAAMIVTLITVGKMLEARAKGKTTDALKGLLNLAPKTATILVRKEENGLKENQKCLKDIQEINEEDYEEKTVAVSLIKPGDYFVVKPGEGIPADGVIKQGYGAIDESSLTGESIPVDKKEDDWVYAGTLNQAGFLTCEATKVGEDTTLSQIISMISDVASTKAPIAKIADRVSGVFVPIVMTIAFLTTIVWLMAGKEAGFALARGISVLVISCPCALGLATPVAIMVGNGVGAKKGILFKTAQALEETGKVQIVALDKTGTITKGEPKVTEIIPMEGISKKELLHIAYSLEKKSEHPLAKAIVAYALEEKIQAGEIKDFQISIGHGLQGRLGEKKVWGGNTAYILGEKNKTEDGTGKKEEIITLANRLAEQGKTPLFFKEEEKFLGIIAVADTIKEDSKEAIKQLKTMGLHVVMVTGDQEKTAKAIGKAAGVDEIIAGVLPQGKEKVISQLKEKAKVAMVGDGINDALALTAADTGIAIGAGTDIAIDAADVVLMKSSLLDVPAAIRLSRATAKNIHENLFWAFVYNVIGIPLAAGLWIPLFGWKLNPMFGALAMSLSSFCVVSNALRLNWVDIDSTKREKRRKQGKKEDLQKQQKESKNSPAEHKEGKAIVKESEEMNMVKIMEIEGMMCGHCEAAVKKALESLPQVQEAVVSHEKNQAVVTLKEAVEEELLKKTVEDKDYTVISIKSEA